MFDSDRLNKITEKWWENKIYKEKKLILEAGLKAYLENNPHGFVSCIKTLITEIEGILRSTYIHDTNTQKRKISIDKLLDHFLQKGVKVADNEDSVLFPKKFVEYLKDVFFKNYYEQEDCIDVTRHSASHGVAKPQNYTKVRALQTILVLDQIRFFLR